MGDTDSILLVTDAWSFEHPRNKASVLLDAALAALGVDATASVLAGLARRGDGNVYLFASSQGASCGLAFDTCNVDNEQVWAVTFAIRHDSDAHAVPEAFRAFSEATMNAGFRHEARRQHPEVLLRFDEGAYPLADGQDLVRVERGGA
jgi:hypothetical protein